VKITFYMAQQQDTNWCWAATASSVDFFYRVMTAFSQCIVAANTLGRSDCCATGGVVTGNCNQPYYLDKALQSVKHLNVFTVGTITPAAIDNELGQNRPVGVRTAWSSGGAHVLVVCGHYTQLDPNTQTSPDWVSVADPAYGNSEVLYNTFLTQYQGIGTWTHTYTTTP
jgi:hypothetical protein